MTRFTRSQIGRWLRTGEMTADRIKQVEEAAKTGQIVDDISPRQPRTAPEEQVALADYIEDIKTAARIAREGGS